MKRLPRWLIGFYAVCLGLAVLFMVPWLLVG